MATKNRRVAAYLPPEVDKAFIAFKIQRGLASEDSPNQNDSQALIQLLGEFLGISSQSGYLVSHDVEGLVTIKQLEALKAELEARMSELFDGLSGELSDVKSKVNALKSADETLTTGQMADRIGVASSTLSHWKKDKSPEELTMSIWEKDQDKKVRWLFVPSENHFRKEGGPPESLQGSLPVDS